MPTRKRASRSTGEVVNTMGSTRRCDLKPKRELSDAALLRSAERDAAKHQAQLERERLYGPKR